jgi:hypothetical protein
MATVDDHMFYKIRKERNFKDSIKQCGCEKNIYFSSNGEYKKINNTNVLKTRGSCIGS